MSIKPILFSTPMVQAILDGRKTMTRRVIKVDDPDNWKVSIAGTSIVRTFSYDVRLSRYKVGDILWVRETWARLNDDYHPDDKGSIYVYKADHITGNDGPDLIKWKPSIFMPRTAARIFLRVTDVRVERLQDISEADADAEGVGGVDNFIKLWDTINTKSGLYKWKNNPFVWTICFERVGKDGKVREIESP